MENAGLTPQLYSGWEALAARLGETELVIDALCGTGLNGPLRGQLAEVVERLNEQKICAGG